MNDLEFLQQQASQLRGLLESVGNDPILAPQLRQKMAGIESKIQELGRPTGTIPFPEPVIPRFAIFLKGPGVQDSLGIRPQLAGDALIQYERMFEEQAIHDERRVARDHGRERRHRGSSTPSLLFVGTPRGSFGLELTPQSRDFELIEVHANSLRTIADAISQVASDDTDSIDRALTKVARRVLPAMKSFFSALSKHGAEMRLAFSDAEPRTITAQQIQLAAERLNQEVSESDVTLAGIFRGLTFDTLTFDFNSDERGAITGTADDALDDDDLTRILGLTNQRCTIKLTQRIVRHADGRSQSTYMMLDVQPEPQGP